ncbi:metallophosphoesterase family protein [Sulfuritalea sp.]|uniref:metallophosphoesterase family protein n=1 Tax=Sulfuritalea sp. TaxID=2480090 RepID=UPI00286E287D|nr:metallophosphoesterase [Sulfuritalea sp.]
MTKPEVEILILDDDRERDDIYKQFFERLSAEPDSSHSIRPLLPKTPTEAHNLLRSRRACLVVLDMVLEGEWQKSAPMTYRIIVDQRYAVALVSNNFNEPENGVTATSVLVELSSAPKLGFIPYAAAIQKYFIKSVGSIEEPDAIPGDTVNVWNFMLAEALGHGRHWRPTIDGEVTFLHLTDTHFGPVQPDYLNVVGMENGIKGSGLHADYILWTGDVTEHGYPSEFQAAASFAQDLVNSKFVETSCPFSVTPGNHDLCWPLALSSRLNLVELPDHSAATSTAGEHIPHQPSDGAKKKNAWVVEDGAVTAELWRFGLSPFREFFTRLVAEPSPEDGYRLLTHWAHLGFAVLELPLEMHVVRSRSDQQEPPPFVSENDFKDISNKVIASFKAAQIEKSVCVIVLIHGQDPNNGKGNVNRWNQLVAEICNFDNAVIVLGGHEHVADHFFVRNRLTVIGVPHDEKKTDGSLTLPGIGFIRLSGLGTNELKCEITKLEKSADLGKNSKWEPKQTSRFAVNPVTNCWIDA